jgi:hypothetical protein
MSLCTAALRAERRLGLMPVLSKMESVFVTLSLRAVVFAW